MSKFSKITIISGFGLIVISLIFASFNLSKLINPFIKSDPGEYTEYTKYVSNINDLNSLVINSTDEKITIKSTDSSEITITYYESERTKYDFRETSESVSLKKVVDKIQFFDFNINLFMPSITVFIPKELVIGYDIKSSNAKIVFSNLNIKESVIETSNSRIDLIDINSLEKLRLITSNGGINLEKVSARGIEMRTTNAGITISESIFNSINGKTSNGKIVLSDTIIKDSILLKTTNSGVKFNDLIAKSIDIETSNGKIEGSLNANSKEYKKDFKTSNGNIWIDNMKYAEYFKDSEETNKLIKLKTSNSSIKINFSK